MLSSRRSRGRSVQAVVLSVLVVGIVGCATQGRPASQAGVRVQDRLEAAGILHRTAEDAGPTSLDSVYNTAVANSAVFRDEHLVGDLWPVDATVTTPMGSFISCNCSGGGGGGGCSSGCSLAPGSRVAPSDIWVSRSDQLLQFCTSLPKTLTAAEVVLKIQQLQGLPPQVNPDPCTWKILQLDVGGLTVPD